MTRPVPASRPTLLVILLPLLFTVLPWIVLQGEIKGAQALREEDEQRQWLVRAKLLSRRFQEVTTPAFWAEELARQLKRDLEPQAGTFDTARLAETARRSVSKRPSGVPMPRIWLASLPDAAGTTSPILCQGSGLEGQFRFFFQTLFRELGRGDLGLPPGIEPLIFQQRIRGFFSEGITSRLFTPDYGGKAFSLVFDRAYYLGIWNILRSGDKPVGAFLMLVPSGFSAHSQAQELAIRHWGRLFRKEQILPAFLDFPLPGKRRPGPATMHPRLARSRGAHVLLDSLRRNLCIRPAAKTGQIGQVDLLGPELSRITSLHGWRAVPVDLGANAGKIGVLLSSIPRPLPTLLERISAWYPGIAGLCWVLVLVWQATGGPFPSPGIKTTLLLWFIGLAATPFALMVGSAQRFSADLASNLSDSLGRDLEQHLRKIDISSVKLDQRFWRLCRTLTESPGLGAHLQRASDEEAHGAKIIDSLWGRCKRAGMDIQGLMLFGHGEFSLARFSPAIGADIASSTTWFHQSLSMELLSRLDPLLARQAKPKPGRKSFASAFSSLGVLGKNQDLLRHPDSVARFDIGNRQTSRYFNLVSHQGRQAFVLIIIWNQGGSYANYLRQAISRSHRESPDIDLAAVGFLGERPRFVARAGDADGLGVLARERRGWGLPLEAENRRLVAWPCRRMPGYLLLAGTSMDPLHERIFEEQRILALSLGGLVLLIFLTAHALSQRLALPVIRMKEGLDKVAEGNLDVHVAELRGDELGDAGRHLDTMTGWLRERSLMSRFVAPQVLEVVAQGNLDRACAGTSREVALLVSDVRSFTTMSESNPPEAIFSLINTHISAMTRVIQRHGGAIDRFIGDAIQAVFYPGPGRSMVDRALLASREMMQEHRRLNRERLAAGTFEYQIGIGVEIGRVVTGVLGDPDVRLDLTVLGEPMKHASDLEAASKAGKAWKVVCSPEVAHLASRDPETTFEFIPLVDPEMGALWELAGEDSGHHPVSHADEGPSPNFPAPRPTTRPISSDITAAGGSDRLKPALDISLRTVPAASGKTSPASTLSMRYALLLWILPFVLVWSGFLALESGEQKRRRQEIRSTLSDDLRLVESALDPQAQLALYLQNRFTQLNQRIAEQSSQREGLRIALESDLHRLAQHLPGVGWATFELVPEHLSSTTTDIRELIRVTSTGGSRCGTDRLFWWNSCSGAAFSLLNLDCPPLEHWMRRSAEVHYSHSSYKDAFRTTFVTFRPISLASDTRIDASGRESAVSTQTRYLFWQPFFKKGLEQALAKDLMKPANQRDSWGTYREYLLGGVLIHVGQNMLDTQRARRLQVINAANRGCRLAVVGETTKAASSIIHPDFRRRKDLQALYAGLSGTSMIRTKASSGSRNWEFLTTEVSGEGARRLIAARPVPNAHRTFPEWRAALIAGSFVWLCLGLGGLFHLTANRSLFRIVLHWQLIAGFLLALVPTLLIGILALERSFGEQRSRLISSERSTIQQLLQAFDQSRSLYVSWSGKAFERVFSDSRVLSSIHSLQGKREKDQNKLGDRLLSRLYFRLSRDGLRMAVPFVLDAGSMYLGRGESGDSDLSPVVVRFFRSLGTVSLRPLQPRSTGSDDPTKAAMDAVYGAGRDEVANLMYNFFPAEQMAGMFNDPRALTGLMFFNTQGYLFRVHLPWRGVPLFSASTRLNGEAFDCLLLPFWNRTLTAQFNPPLSIRASEREQVGICLVPPYFTNQVTLDANIKLKEVMTYLTPMEAADNQLSLTAGTAVFRTVGQGRDTRLHVAIPGKDMPTAVLSTVSPIGLKMGNQAREMNVRRGLLGLLLLFSVGMAWSVARRFLVPIMDLSEAARQIMSGNFQIRLSESSGAEFGSLARAFNHMAGGVAEGRLLSRFVSDSVRGAARDQARQLAAQRGESLDVIVLFAGLADFKSLLISMPPDQLIGRLNRYLQTMSRAIRQEGGEIDKFIGDKILAVFHPRSLGGPAAASAAAVRAADAMRRAMPSLSGILDRPLGVGLVRGPVLAGIMGTEEVRLEYTVIGDTVNLASRLGDLALKLGPDGSIGDGKGCFGGVVVEASLQPLLLGAGAADLSDRLERLQLPPIKGKTRSVDAFVLREKS